MGIVQTALRLADSIGGLSGMLDRPFDVARLIRKAQQATGLTDFGDMSFVEPLERLLRSFETESNLSIVGRGAVHWDTIRFLSNLLWIEEAGRQAPEMTRQPIEKPIFVTGLPRSGTTFLHRLLLLDHHNRGPLVWETIYPSAASGRQAERVQKVAKQLKTIEVLAPDFRSLHPLEATSPQECSEITSHVFRSLRFDTTYLIPSYRSWLDGDEQRQLPAFQFHKRFLQYLQQLDGNTPRWVVKCPEHLFALNVIRDVYPDARMVFVHRDPVKVLLSQARLTEVLRRPFTRHLDPSTLGADESRRWHEGCLRMMQASVDNPYRDPICHIHHLDLITDPVGTVDKVYRHFGLSLPEETIQAIDAYVRARPNGGYGQHSYNFADHGLNETEERERFHPYMAHFGIAAESSSRGLLTTGKRSLTG